MPDRDLNPIDPVSIPGLDITLTDQEDLPTDVQFAANEIMLEVLRDQAIGSHRPTTQLCGQEQEIHEDGLYQAALSVNPRTTFTQHRTDAGDAIVRDDSDLDPRLPVKTFVVQRPLPDGELLGTWTLYNIELERDNALGRVATALAMPGCRAAPRHTLRETWSGIMRWILENDFTLDGLPLDFIAWRFPTRRSHRWFFTAAEVADRRIPDADHCASVGVRLVVGDLDGHDLEKDADGAPKTVRRSGAPPPPSS